MTGLPFLNFAAFDHANEILVDAGWCVESPADHDRSHGEKPDASGQAMHPFHVYMERDLPLVAKSNALFMLLGWQHSRGALLEATVADALGIPRYDFETMRLIAPFGTRPVDPKMMDVPPAQEETIKPRKEWTPEQVVAADVWYQNTVDSTYKTPVMESRPGLDFGPKLEPQVYEATGGRKGRRHATMSLIPVYARIQEARVHGFALSKYPDAAIGTPNWTLGVPMSWFADALERHYTDWLSSRTFDGESTLHNLAHVRWMSAALMELGRMIEAGILPADIDDRRAQ